VEISACPIVPGHFFHQFIPILFFESKYHLLPARMRTINHGCP
jgi:hypothetical protein